MARTRQKNNKKETPTKASSRAMERGQLGKTFEIIGKKYGANLVHSADNRVQPNRISSGSFIFDFATLGGIPESRLSMVVGEKHAGKTMIASKLIASAQRLYPDMTPVILDVEGTFEPTWAEQLGVDIHSLPVSEALSGEMAVDVGCAITESAETSLLVVDSIPALVPMAEIDSSAEDAMVGVQARLVGRFIRKIVSAMIAERARGHSVTVLFINQFRSKIGGFNPGFGEPRSIPGGKALEYATSLQWIMKNKENAGKSADESGIDSMVLNEHSYTITKNKMNGGPRTGEFKLVREQDPETNMTPGDIDDAHTVLAYSKKFGLYRGGGSSRRLEFMDYTYGFRRDLDAVQALRDDYDMYWDLRTHLIRLQAARLGQKREFIERIN